MKYLLFVVGVLAVALVAGLAHLQLLAALWIPLFMLLFLVGFPLVAVAGQSSLLWGLFDLDLSPRLRLPIRHYFATLSAFFVAGSAICIIQVVLQSGHDRFGLERPDFWPWINDVFVFDSLEIGNFLRLFAVLGGITIWFMLFALATSWNQDRRRSLFRMIVGVVLGLATGAASLWIVALDKTGFIGSAGALDGSWPSRVLGPGYEGHWRLHVASMLAFFLALVLYAALGLYGSRVLGKDKMVAAIIGPLMVILVLGWAGSAAQFFLGRWHIPLLLVVAVGGWINGMLPWADHTYNLLPRGDTPAPQPFQVLTAKDRSCAIVVAAAGGGIQAAAWTAKVLQELHNQFGAEFDRALCLVSSISGGSTGTACYVDWLKRGAPQLAIKPFDAASASSLDEVSWGLAWPDLLRVLIAWPFQMDRALAMEQAWIQNSGSGTLNQPLSDWNPATLRGDLPSVIMNSTMVEVGGPLLLGTSDVNSPETGRKSSCWWDGDELHIHDGKKLDIPVVRAARLSATFPFVTPAARPVKANHEPHMMDGGFYDNYGMATLTEWVEQALEEQASKYAPGSERVKRLLVVQVNGFPRSDFAPPKKSSGGWVSQLIAPIKILVNVRTAGQVSHRDMELSLLKGKWRARGIEIENVNFELDEKNAPLSWHLMPKQRAAIEDAWTGNPYVVRAQQKVANFLRACPSAVQAAAEPPLADSAATEATASV